MLSGDKHIPFPTHHRSSLPITADNTKKCGPNGRAKNKNKLNDMFILFAIWRKRSAQFAVHQSIHFVCSLFLPASCEQCQRKIQHPVAVAQATIGRPREVLNETHTHKLPKKFQILTQQLRPLLCKWWTYVCVLQLIIRTKVWFALGITAFNCH